MILILMMLGNLLPPARPVSAATGPAAPAWPGPAVTRHAPALVTQKPAGAPQVNNRPGRNGAPTSRTFPLPFDFNLDTTPETAGGWDSAGRNSENDNLDLPTATAISNLSQLSLSFVPNVGQTDPTIRFQAHGLLGSNLFFTPGEVGLSLPHSANTLRLRFEGANKALVLVGRERRSGLVNYFLGNNPANWQTDVPTYDSIIYRDLYPGIDLHYNGTEGTLKGTYVVAVGADPGLIKWRYAGARRVDLDDSSGDLLITPLNEREEGGGEPKSKIVERAPVAWQEIYGRRIPITVDYILADDGGLSFRLGNYNPAYPLTIDPVLEYSTYFGGSNEDSALDIAVDSAGDVYIIGVTESLSNTFPITNPLSPPPYDGGVHSGDETGGPPDVFVAKLTWDGSVLALDYCTYLGGAHEEGGEGIAVDSNGSAYVTGYTYSADFPMLNPLRGEFGTGTCGEGALCSDAFVTKLSAAGNQLVYSTFLNGSENDKDDRGHDIAVDDSGNAYIVGTTGSGDFPIVNPAPGYDTRQGSTDVFISKIISASGVYTYGYSTYFGGTSSDEGQGLAVDEANNVYITGVTRNLSPTLGAVQPGYGGNTDAFIAKMTWNESANTLTRTYSSYLGGSQYDTGSDIAVDNEGNIYLTGWTASTQYFPTYNTSFQQNYGGGYYDAFVTKIISASGVYTYGYSTYLGGNGSDEGSGLAVDSAGKVYVTGNTISGSGTFPKTQDALRTDLGYCNWCGSYCWAPCADAFVTTLTATGDLLYGTYLGGYSYDYGYGIAIDNNDDIYVTGYTTADFPQQNPLTLPNPGSINAFVTKLAATPAATEADLAVSKAVFPDPVSASSTLTYTLVLTNNGPALATAVTLTDTLPTGVLISSLSSNQGSCTETSGLVTCNIGSVASGGAAGVTIGVTPTVVGQIVNTVEITAAEFDPDTLNNTAAVTTTISDADIAIRKTGPAQAVSGQSILYNLTIKNEGAMPTSGIVVTDTLPLEITYVGHSAPVTPTVTATGSGEQITWELEQPLNGGQSLAFALVGQVTDTVIAGQLLQNVVQVGSTTTDEDLTNNAFTATTTIISPYSHTLTLTPASLTARRGATETVRLQINNTGPLADVYTVSVTGLDPAWYTPITKSFALNPAASTTADLKLHVNDCGVSGGTTPFTVTVYSQQSANQVAAASGLTLLTAPQQLDLTPAGGSTTGSRSQLFTWRTDAPTTGQLTVYPSLTPTQLITVTTPLSQVHLVPVDNLDRNTDYTWFVESESACGDVTTGANHTFTVGNGIVFDPHTRSEDIARDYGQLITMTLRNEDSLTHTLRVTVTHPYQDVIAGFIGPGSIDDGAAYITLPPGQTHDAVLAIHTQDAQQEDYHLTAQVTADEGSSDEIVDYAHLSLRVLEANDFSLTQVATDTATLVKTYEVRNLGLPITDLSIKALDPATGLPARVLIQPTLDHARLAKAGDSGDSLTFEVIPLFSPEDAIVLQAASHAGASPGLASPLWQTGFDVTLVANVLDTTQALPGNFACQAQAQLYAVTLHNVRVSYTNNDWYCTNRPNINLNFSTPGNINMDDILAATVTTGFNPAPGWHVLPHDVRLLLNGCQVGELLNQVPSGSYTFGVDPAFFNPAANPVQPVNQSLRLRTTHMNGGHYVVNTASRLDLDLANFTRYVCAGSPDDARNIAGQGTQPIATEVDIQITQPTAGTEPEQGQPVTLRAEVNDYLTGQLVYPVRGVITYTQKIVDGNPYTETLTLGYTGSVGDLDTYQAAWTPLYPGEVSIQAIVEVASLRKDSEPVAVRVLFQIGIPPSPPTIPLPDGLYKGANWLRYFDDTPLTDFEAKGVKWNLETSDKLRVGLPDNLPPDPTQSDPTTLGAEVNRLYRAETVYTIGRLVLDKPRIDPAEILNKTCQELLDLKIEENSETTWAQYVDNEYIQVLHSIGGSEAIPIFILHNEPNHPDDEWAYSAAQYAKIYNCYYEHWRVKNNYPHWLFVAGPGQGGRSRDGSRETETYQTFYQNLLNTGTETITYADGFAIHAYGYYYNGPGEGENDIRDDLPNGNPDNGFRDWLWNWHEAIGPRSGDPGVYERPVIITEYNPGAEVAHVNSIPDTWTDWFDSTYCWAKELDPNGQIRGLLYFVDEATPDRISLDKIQKAIEENPETEYKDYHWYRVSLQSDADDRRNAWFDAPTNAAGTCTPPCQIPAEQGSQTSIGGSVSGTLGTPGANNIFHVTEDLTVPVEQTLNIALGTTLVFSPGVRMEVGGQLFAEGNTVFPIRFISTDAAGWAGLHFEPSAQGSRCVGCYLENIEAGGVALQTETPMTFQYGLIRNVPDGTAISTTVPLTLANVLIDYVDTSLYVSGLTTPFTTSHLTIGRCQSGVVNHGQTLALDNSILNGCGIAISTTLSGTTSISYSLLHGNGENFVTETGSQLEQGLGLLDADPDFVNFPVNYLLQPDSPAVDAANPQADYSRELGYNGGRADLGAYGNTWQAPQQPPLEQMGIALEADIPQRIGRPGQTLTYTVILRNIGSVTDIFTVETDGHSFRSSLFEDGRQTPRPIELAPQEQISVTIWVEIPLTPTTSSLSNTVMVRAFNGYGIQAETELTTLPASFQETGGQVVMEAENFNLQIERSGRSWLTQTVLSGYVGASYLSALPDTDLLFTTNYTTASPELEYLFTITTTGVYTVWLRGYAPNGAGDSVYIALDNQTPLTPTVLTGFSPAQWEWAARTSTSSNSVTFEISEPGLHTFHLWQREDGLRLDRILLTSDNHYNPTDSGPPESEFK